jgi:hypothetical protein
MSIGKIDMPAEILENVIDLAFRVSEELDQMTEWDRAEFMCEHFRATPVIWAVWPDVQQESIFHCLIVKGPDLPGGSHETTAFLVSNQNAAEMMRDTLGDGAPAITHSMPAGVM